MKKIRSKFLVKLIASLCIVISFLGIVANNCVLADDDDEVFGGVLLTPVTRLITAFADGTMDILHSATLNQDSTIIRLDAKADTWWQNWGRTLFAIITAIGIATAIIILSIGTGGIAAAIGAASTKLIGTIFVVKTFATGLAVGAAIGGGWWIVGEVLDSTMMDDDICIPVFNLTPEEIFSNKIWIFDVNFFEPEQDKGFYLTEINNNDLSGQEIANKISGHGERLVGAGIYSYNELHSFFEVKKEEGSRLAIDNNVDSKILDIIVEVNDMLKEVPRTEIDYNNKYEMIIENVSEDVLENNSVGYTEKRIEFKIYNKEKSQEYIKVAYNERTDNIYDVQTNLLTQTIREEIRIKMLNDVSQEEITEASRVESIATTLRGVISKWYFILRNLALLVLMLLLIYSGIRIVIGSTAGEKAKYKERLQDWLVGMCLVFLMHYIMVFAVELNEKFIKLIDTTNGNQGISKIIQLSTQNHINEANKHEELKEYIKTGTQMNLKGNSNTYLVWPTNLMGGIRIEQQLVNEGTVNWIGYALCYVVLVVYTVSFTWTYLKRVLYMAFLTMISPLVAMTYPLDKLTDGKAQAFNAWLKEYIFNLLIQPFHLLLYTVLVTSAFELVGKNALYALVAIGFMTPAEKLLRKFFGFEKAQTPGLLGGAAGAALAMSGLQKLMAFGDKGKNPEQDEESDKDDIKFSSSNAVSAKAVMASNQLKDIRTNNSENDGTEGGSNNIITPIESDTEGDELATNGVRLGGATLLGNRRIEHDKLTIDPETDPDKVIPDSTQKGVPRYAMGSAGPKTGRTIKAGEGIDVSGEEKHIKAGDLINQDKRRPGVIRSAIGSYNRLQGQKMYKRLKKARPIRALARGATGLFGGALLGMAGLALGIASGDPSKAFQYTTAGATGGFAVGKGIAGKVVDAASVNTNKLSDEISVAYYGEDYKNQKLKQEKEKLKRNEDYIMYLRKTFGVSRNDAINILDTTGADCLDSGITDIEDIAAQHLYINETLAEQENAAIEANILEPQIANIKNGIELEDEERSSIEEEVSDSFLQEEIRLRDEENKIQEDLRVEDERIHLENERQDQIEIENKQREDEEEAARIQEENEAEAERIRQESEQMEEQIKREIQEQIRRDEEEIDQKAEEELAKRINQEENAALVALAHAHGYDIREAERQLAQDGLTEDEKASIKAKIAQTTTKYEYERDSMISSMRRAERRKIVDAKQAEIRRSLEARYRTELEARQEQRQTELETQREQRKIELETQRKQRKTELEAQQQTRRDELNARKKKNLELQEQLRKAKENMLDEKEEQIKYQKARKIVLSDKQTQESIAHYREWVQMAIASKDPEMLTRRKEIFEQGVVMKKFSDRTPDFSKMTEKKIKSYRDQFKIEMKEELKKQLKARGMSDAEAEKEAEARSGTAADQIIQGIIRYDTTKSRLLEV